MEPLATLADDTVAYFERGLGVSLQPSEQVFRDSSSLQGQWLGAFAEGAFLSIRKHAFEMTLDVHGYGRSSDYGGPASIKCLRNDPDVFAFEKRYQLSGVTLLYMGSRTGGRITGYWRSAQSPWIAGVFTMFRSDVLSDDVRAKMMEAVGSSLRFRVIVIAVSLGLLGVLLAGPRWTYFVIGPSAVLVLMPLATTFALRGRVRRWRKLLGTG